MLYVTVLRVSDTKILDWIIFPLLGVGQRLLGWIATTSRGFQKWSWPTSPTPRKLPNGRNFGHGSTFLTKNWSWNFSLKFMQRPKWVKKYAPGFQKHLLHLFELFSWVLRCVEISTTLGVFLNFLTCGSKIFKNRKFSKISKNIIFQHLLFFCCFLGKVG